VRTPNPTTTLRSTGLVLEEAQEARDVQRHEGDEEVPGRERRPRSGTLKVVSRALLQMTDDGDRGHHGRRQSARGADP